jgi:proline dehydrogenase
MKHRGNLINMHIVYNSYKFYTHKPATKTSIQWFERNMKKTTESQFYSLSANYFFTIIVLNMFIRPSCSRILRKGNVNVSHAKFLSSKIDFNDSATSFKSKSLTELVRGYLVFQTCRIKFLVNNSEAMVGASYSILGDRITDFVLRKTFFGHFCAGSDTTDMEPTIRRLEKAGIGSILDYAAEADFPEEEIRPLTPAEAKIKTRVYDYRDEELCDTRAKVFERCIRSAHELQGTKNFDGFAAVKVTALGNPLLLERISIAITEIRNLFLKFDVNKTGKITKEQFKTQYEFYFTGGLDVEEVYKALDCNHDEGIDYVEWTNTLTIEDLHKMTSFCREHKALSKATLTEEERALLLLMRKRITALAELANELNVKLMIDAEHTYFQPAIDNIATTLMKSYNKDRALIFSTYQMYLTDSCDRLKDDITRARLGNYHFAAKLVRGAYMELERKRALEKGYPSPIHATKEDTHKNYNDGIAAIIEKMAAGEKVHLMIATHNQQSIELALEAASARGLGPESSIFFGQLLGMADHLTYSLGGAKYKAYKYVPYGMVKEVMPYLIRRAQENSDMLGGVGKEISMIQTEILNRLKLK